MIYKMSVAALLLSVFYSSDTLALTCYNSGGYDIYTFQNGQSTTTHYPTKYCTVGERYSATNPYTQNAAWYQSARRNYNESDSCYQNGGVNSVVIPPGEIEVGITDVLNQDDFRAYAWQEMAKYVQEHWGGKTEKQVNIEFVYSASVGGSKGTNILNVPIEIPDGKSLYESIIDQMDGHSGMDLEKDEEVMEEASCSGGTA